MKQIKDKLIDGVVSFFVIAFLLIFSPIIVVGFLISTVKDYFEYKKTSYYLDTGAKYSWFCARSDSVTLYNAIKKEGLSIDFYRNNELKAASEDYFILDDALILFDFDSDMFYFDKEKDDWMFYEDHESILLENEVDKEIKKVNDFLGENRCRRAIIFVEKELLHDIPEKHYERIEFLTITEGDKISTLKSILAKN